MVDSEHRANAVAALSPEARVAQEAYRRESRRFTLLRFGPLLVGFIPANTGRRGIGHQRERSSHSDCGLFRAIFHSLCTSLPTQRKAVPDAHLELCPHCGSAVRRGKGPDCLVCDKSPQLIWREGSSSLVQARFDVIVNPTCAAEQFSSRYSKLGIPGPSRG